MQPNPKTLHHVEGPLLCPRCEAELMYCHPYVRNWFRWIKGIHPDAHIAWGYRDMLTQNRLYAESQIPGNPKLTNAKWPFSEHNRCDPQGEPESYAVDIFEQVGGRAKWDPIFYCKVADETRQNGYKIFWGKEFKAISGDQNHFQYDPNMATHGTSIGNG